MNGQQYEFGCLLKISIFCFDKGKGNQSIHKRGGNRVEGRDMNMDKKDPAVIIGYLCIVGSLAGYIMAMVLGSNAVFAIGLIFAGVGIYLGRKTDIPNILVLNGIILILIILELFMRVRDGYNGTGMYYIHLLQHPEDNAWY